MWLSTWKIVWLGWTGVRVFEKLLAALPRGGSPATNPCTCDSRVQTLCEYRSKSTQTTERCYEPVKFENLGYEFK